MNDGSFAGKMRAAVVVSLLMCLTMSAVCFGQGRVTKAVRTRGEAPVWEGNLVAAFEEAKSIAFRNAVEEALGVMVSSQSRVRNFALIADDILTESVGYVSSFEVVERGRQGNGGSDSYFVVIDAVVDLNNLNRDLAGASLLLEAAGRPRISCEGTEFTVADDGETQEQANGGNLERSLARALRAVGGAQYIVVPSGIDGQPAAEISAIATAAVERANALLPLGGGTLADVGLVSVSATIHVQAWWIDSGQLIASSKVVGRGADVTLGVAAARAIEEGVGRIAEEFGQAIMTDIREKVYSGRMLQLVVLGEPEPLRRFESDLPNLGAVEKLFRRTYETGKAVYEARSRTNGFELSRELSGSALSGLDIEIRKVSANALELSVAD